MNKILIASGNTHKIVEIKSALKDIKDLRILSLKNFGLAVPVDEDGETLEQNSFKKSKEVFDILKIPCISDDTGLFVDKLNGAPGVLSARYSGENATYLSNCEKLLDEFKHVPDSERTAKFESVICYYISETKHYFFRGICKGKITTELRGSNGFGYDPLFIPDGFDKTFGEMSESEKNLISHRALAIRAFADFLKQKK